MYRQQLIIQQTDFEGETRKKSSRKTIITLA